MYVMSVIRLKFQGDIRVRFAAVVSAHFNNHAIKTFLCIPSFVGISSSCWSVSP